MKKLLLNILMLFIFPISATESVKEVSCNPQNIHNYLSGVYTEARSLKKFALNQKTVQAITILEGEMNKLFLDQIGTNCTYNQAAIQQVQDDTKNSKAGYCDLQFIIAPMINRINHDNDCNLITLKSIASIAYSCPEGQKLMNIIYHELKNPNCKQEFAEFAKTLSKK